MLSYLKDISRLCCAQPSLLAQNIRDENLRMDADDLATRVAAEITESNAYYLEECSHASYHEE